MPAPSWPKHDRPVGGEASDTVHDMQIAVADPGRDGTDQHLAALWRIDIDRFDRQRFACGLRKTAASICIGTSSTGTRGFAERSRRQAGPVPRESGARYAAGNDRYRDTRSGYRRTTAIAAYRPNVRPINTLVLHYTGMQSAEAALDRLCDPEAKVSSHYLVEEDGAVWRLVLEARRAFHAGVSCWLGEERSQLGVDRHRDRQSRP